MPDNRGSNPSLSLTPLNRVICPALNLIPPRTPPRLFDSAVQHFTSIPWCADLLLNAPSAATAAAVASAVASAASSHRQPNPSAAIAASKGTESPVIPFIPQCFNPASDRHDQFVGSTLANAPRALRHMLCLFRPDDAHHLRDPSRPVARVSALFSFGDGLSGYEGLLHGGMAATMMDETLGTINELNKALAKADALFDASSVTASLNITFRRPIPVQGEVCVTAWVESIQGRKTNMKCELTGPDGKVLASATSTWVALKSNM
ncbi:thioesterase superfamily protein [Hirsutella rhossiliensis]|uniref:Acyl-coenzyme A thioesterase THEM4 n=1 Tax=Hirsutella rhossiliensis TaxID=111463 RepID=A0A9P8MWV2_9HYPO|nr:thioesterase superfamily domain-containing protein [Hirsutella rhossiliensis]KAH0962837.1 thioesterase superfamily domain-containing protein [Hirsutella rhossiliensis]